MRPSRSAIATRRQCPTRRYWAFDYAGKGLERKSASLPLVGGTRQHAAHARILMGANVDQVVAEEQVAYREEIEARGVNGTLPEHLDFLIREQQTLFEGLVRGWVKFRLPLILDEYEPVSIEQEWLVDMGDGFELPLRLDVLERHRGTGLLHIRDFKTVGYLRDGWREHYLHDLQTVLYCEAVERHTQEYVGGMEYEALLKGGRRQGTDKHGWADRELQQSPLCYGYAIEQNGQREYQSAYTTRKGSRKFAVWQEFEEVEDWLEGHLEESVWRELYAVSGMMCPTEEEQATTLDQVKRGERLYREALDEICLDLHDGESVQAAVAMNLERNTDHCFAYGSRHACPFLDLCFSPGTEPLEEGSGFQLRTDHHSTGEPEQEREAA